MGEVVRLAEWKKHPATAGAMMLLRGYAEPVTTCDGCGQGLAREDGVSSSRARGGRRVLRGRRGGRAGWA